SAAPSHFPQNQGRKILPFPPASNSVEFWSTHSNGFLISSPLCRSRLWPSDFLNRQSTLLCTYSIHILSQNSGRFLILTPANSSNANLIVSAAHSNRLISLT